MLAGVGRCLLALVGLTCGLAAQFDILPVSLPLGQVSGLGINPLGKLVVFHRADRVWDADSFDDNFSLNPSLGAIPNDTLYVIEPVSGQVTGQHGAGAFYMPHGLTVDAAGNVWVTDVGLHQVMRLNGTTFKPSLVLGEPLVPGSDDAHFCQPTDVAVASNGVFFVADGYCNGRILKFAANGTLLDQFGQLDGDEDGAAPGEFLVPHSLALIEDLDVLCVADRNNERIQCVAAGLTSSKSNAGHNMALPFGAIVTLAENVGAVHAIREKQHYLVGLTQGPEIGANVFVIDIATSTARTLVDNLAGHALAIAESGDVYVGQTDEPPRIVRIPSPAE